MVYLVSHVFVCSMFLWRAVCIYREVNDCLGGCILGWFTAVFDHHSCHGADAVCARCNNTLVVLYVVGWAH